MMTIASIRRRLTLGVAFFVVAAVAVAGVSAVASGFDDGSGPESGTQKIDEAAWLPESSQPELPVSPDTGTGYVEESDRAVPQFADGGELVWGLPWWFQVMWSWDFQSYQSYQRCGGCPRA